MAKIKFGMMMTDARGKLGGQVFSKNRGGAFVRTKVSPTNPQTENQLSARSRLAAGSTGWSALTEERRAQWNAAVESYKKTDIFGDLRTPSGKNLFTGLNSNLRLVNVTVLTEPKSPIELVDPLALAFEDLSPASMVISGMPVVAGQKYVVCATPPMSAGTYNFGNKYRVIAIEEGDAIGIDFAEPYILKYGAFAAGKKIGVKVYVVATSTGQSSVGVKISAIVAS